MPSSLRASRANESFARLFKGGGVQGRSPCPRSAERGSPLCLLKRRRGFKGEPSPGVPPSCFLALCVCADTLGGGRWPVLRFDPISLVLAQRNGVEPPKKGAFLPRRLHHPRERYRSVDGTFLARLWGGLGACRGLGAGAPFSWVEVSSPYCPFHPISLLLRKETGWSPKETRFWRWAEPDNDSDARAVDWPRKAAITNPVRPRRRQPLR